MKKILLALLAVCTLTVAYSQKLRDAKKSLKNAQEKMMAMKTDEAVKELNEAKNTLEALAADPKMIADPDYWMTKAFVYSFMAEVPEFADADPMATASTSIDKALQIDVKKTLKIEGAKELIANNGFNHFNNGVNNANRSDYKQAEQDFEKAYNMLNLDEGKTFKGHGQIDTIKSKSLYMHGLTAYYAEDYTASTKSLELASQNPITAKESSLYLNLANAYGKLKQREKQLATIEKGKKLFPDDANIFAAEVNYYIDGGESDKVVAKLEEQIKKDPKREDYHYNLGLTYMELVKRNSGKPEELTYLEKASQSFHNAADINPENPSYYYYEGTALFNAGATVNDELMKTTDMSAMKKLEDKRNTIFKKAIPAFNKVNELYKKKDKSKLSQNDLSKWEQSLRALTKIYAELDMTTEYNQVVDELNKL